MHTEGMDEAGRKTMLDALAAGGALHLPAEPQESDWTGLRDEVVRGRSAMHGMKIAVPLAITLWALAAGVLWVVCR
jgi:hypothetical protein